MNGGPSFRKILGLQLSETNHVISHKSENDEFTYNVLENRLEMKLAKR